ncbi:hypothetical protein IQ782_24155 [Salipiger pacificus]|uniref:Uncharacterized protein n=1 Tax=Salipiger mangrovisoli TaxID=2865933 RepID=A0ABR9X909_9RHOB|nr:hypothetical protein [Salipiger mangrovisoli]
MEWPTVTIAQPRPGKTFVYAGGGEWGRKATAAEPAVRRSREARRTYPLPLEGKGLAFAFTSADISPPDRAKRANLMLRTFQKLPVNTLFLNKNKPT